MEDRSRAVRRVESFADLAGRLHAALAPSFTHPHRDAHPPERLEISSVRRPIVRHALDDAAARSLLKGLTLAERLARAPLPDHKAGKRGDFRSDISITYPCATIGSLMQSVTAIGIAPRHFRDKTDRLHFRNRLAIRLR